MTVYEISLIATGANMLINYSIGKPGGEFSPYEIFSQYTIWLSKRRLRKVGLWKQYQNQYNDNFIRMGIKCSSKECRFDNKLISLKNDFKKIIYNAAEPFFTWERAFGMCSICTGFWISLVFGLIFTFNILELAEIIVLSHITIRIVNKIL